jgi:general secretion pathway protein I
VFRPKLSERGFTLIEVLTALAILAVSLGVLFQSFSTGLRNVDVSEDYALATGLAESKLATVGIEEPLEAGETTGRFDDRFHWRVIVEPYAEEPADEDASAVEAFEVVITVAWGEADAERSISLATLRLAP